MPGVMAGTIAAISGYIAAIGMVSVKALRCETGILVAFIYRTARITHTFLISDLAAFRAIASATQSVIWIAMAQVIDAKTRTLLHAATFTFPRSTCAGVALSSLSPSQGSDP